MNRDSYQEIKISDDTDFIYSVRTPKKPPFIARTNDFATVERINNLFIKIGGWENAKFLLENLRLNENT